MSKGKRENKISTIVNYYVVFPQDQERFPEENFHYINVHKINVNSAITALILTTGETHVDKLFHFFHSICTPITRIIKTNRGQLIPTL